MKQEICKLLFAAAFVSGLLLAGCECDRAIWPWVNISGVVIFGGAAAGAACFYRKDAKSFGPTIYGKR